MRTLFFRTEVRRKDNHSVQDSATADTDIGRLVFGDHIADHWSRSLPDFKPSNL